MQVEFFWIDRDGAFAYHRYAEIPAQLALVREMTIINPENPEKSCSENSCSENSLKIAEKSLKILFEESILVIAFLK